MLRNPFDAEDASQDVFVLVFLKIHTFRGESAFSSWLYRLATNVVLMRFRRNKRYWTPLGSCRQYHTDSSGEIDAPDPRGRGLFDRIDLQAAIDVLPAGYKAALILHDVHGYGHKEIATLFGYSVGNSKSQLHRARRQLRKLLADVVLNGAGKRYLIQHSAGSGKSRAKVLVPGAKLRHVRCETEL